MTGVCFFFEDNDRDMWSGRPIDFDAWRYAAQAFGIDRLACIDRSSERLACFVQRTSVLQVFADEAAFQRATGNDRKLYLTPKSSLRGGETAWALSKIKVRPDWYCFGPAMGWDGTPRDRAYAYIDQAEEVALHAVHAAQIVMYHHHLMGAGNGGTER